MTLDLHQRKALAESIWNARDFVIDCREDVGRANVDDETLRQLAICIGHLAHIAEKLEEPTPEDELQWGKKLKAYRKEDAIHDQHLLEEETQAEHDLDVSCIRYAGAH